MPSATSITIVKLETLSPQPTSITKVTLENKGITQEIVYQPPHAP